MDKRQKTTTNQINAPYKEKKTPITSYIINNKHQDLLDKRKNIHKTKLSPQMTHKIHTTQIKTNISTWASLESWHKPFKS